MPNKSFLKKFGLYLMSLFYLTAGLGHFFRPELYLRMMPSWLPRPLALIYISGAAECGLALALLFPKIRNFAAWGIIALLIAVFPANLEMLRTHGAGFNISDWVLILRLPVQGILIIWAYQYAKNNTTKMKKASRSIKNERP